MDAKRTKRLPGQPWKEDDIPVNPMTGEPTDDWPQQRRDIDAKMYGEAIEEARRVEYCGATPRYDDVDAFGTPGWEKPGPVALDGQGRIVTSHRVLDGPTRATAFVNWTDGDGRREELALDELIAISSLAPDPSSGDLVVSGSVSGEGGKAPSRIYRIDDDKQVVDRDIFEPLRRRFESQYYDLGVNDLAVDDDGAIYAALSLVRARRAEERGGRLHVGEMMVAKVASDGELIWTKKIETEFFAQDSYFAGSSSLTQLVVTDEGGVLAAGNTANHFGEYRNQGHTDVVLFELDADGHMKWQRAWGSESTEFVASLTLDERGRIALGGGTRGAFHGPYADLPPPTDDAFVMVLDRQGRLQWAHQFGSKYRDLAGSVLFDENGGVDVVGMTHGDFRQPDAYDFTRSRGHRPDIFVARFDANGRLDTVDQFGTDEHDETMGGAVRLADGRVKVFGSTRGDLGGERNRDRTKKTPDLFIATVAR
jgi:hypothetical protein